MARRKRDENGNIITKKGTVDKRTITSKENLKKSPLYQRVIKNKEEYESGSDVESDDEDVDEFEVVEFKKKEPIVVDTVEEVVEEPIVVEAPAVVEAPVVVKREKRLKIIKEESDDDESDDEEEVEVVKRKRYKKKIETYNSKISNYEMRLKKELEEKENLKKKIVYNSHLNNINRLSRDITLKF